MEDLTPTALVDSSNDLKFLDLFKDEFQGEYEAEFNECGLFIKCIKPRKYDFVQGVIYQHY